MNNPEVDQRAGQNSLVAPELSGNTVEFLKNILDSSTEYSIIGKDLAGNIELWNEGARRNYGYASAEIVGKLNSSVLYAPADVASGRHRAIMAEALRHGKWEGTLLRVRQNGQPFTARLVITPRLDSAGQPIGFLAISKDISEEAELSEELKATQYYARSLIEASLDPLVTISPEGKITDVNEGSVRVTGVPRDQLIGTDFSDYFTAPQKAAEGYKQVFELGFVTDYPLTIRHKDGRLTDVLYNASVYKDTLGNVLGVFAAARDVTTQKQASQYARSLIEASLDPLVTISAEGKITDVNEGSVRVTGMPRDQLIGTDFSDYFTEPQKAAEGYKQVFDQGFVTDYPLTIRRKDGKLTDVLYNASVYRDTLGNVLGVFASARDVTDRKQAENRQRASAAYARSLIEASVDPLVTISSEGKITDVNRATELVTGIPRQRLTGTDFSDYFTAPDKAREGYQQVFSQGFVKDYPLAIRHSTGRVTDVLYNASVYKDDKGQVIGVFAAARDVTGQKMAEELQRAASAYARSLIEASLDPLVTISAQGKITDVNEASAQATGLPREQLIGTDFLDYFTEPEKAREGYLKVFSEGLVRDYPLAIRHTTGRVTDVLYNAAVYKDDAGQVLGVFAAARDVTELRKADATLKLAVIAAETASRTKSDFLANMSHEIRTPMNAIIGMTYLAQQNNPDPKQGNYLTKIGQASKQLLGIINDILDTSKIEAGKLEMEEVEFKLSPVFDHLGDLLNLKADEKGLELIFDIAPDLPYLLIGDPLRLGQILLNLGVNAVKFTDQGQITVAVKAQPQAASLDHIKLEFSVKDSGIGMTPEQCANLFKSFSQADSSITRKYGGTGLGLVIAKSLVELMDGRVWVESVLGAGTVFHFTARFGEAKVQPPKLRARQLPNKRLLVVDDHADSRELLAQVAGGFGMQVDTAAGGEQALRMIVAGLARQQPYDLLLTDWKMPGMDGVKLLRELQRLQLPIGPALVMVSAYRREELLEALHGEHVACAEIVSKPVKPSAFFNALMAALQPDDAAVPRDARARNSATTSAEAAAALSQLHLSGRRVLLVEDNDLNQELAAELLRQVGVVVDVANDGQQALDALAQRNGQTMFDAILMDCHMPVMDGYQASRVIRNTPAWADLPIIALTADAMKGTREKVLGAGMSDYLTKPLEVDKLYATLARCIAASALQAARTEARQAGAPRDARLSATDLVLPGIDQRAGLRVCNGNEVLYIKLLKMFRQGQADFGSPIHAALQDADRNTGRKAVRLSAHTLRGSAASIGAKWVAAAAAELEQACQENAPQARLEALRDQVLLELAPVMAGLQQLN